MSSDDEYEEETTYVVADLGPDIPPDAIERYAQQNATIRLLGLEEGTPFLQIDGATFQGEIDETVGTNLIFEINKQKRSATGLLPLLNSSTGERDESAPRHQRIGVKYVGETCKVMRFQKVLLHAKADTLEREAAQNTRDTEDMEIEPPDNDIMDQDMERSSSPAGRDSVEPVL